MIRQLFIDGSSPSLSATLKNLGGRAFRRLNDRGEVAAHGRLQVRDRPANSLKQKAAHPNKNTLTSRKAPDVDGRTDVVAGLALAVGN